MKRIMLLACMTVSLICASCTTPQESTSIEKEWLGKSINFDNIQEVVNYYHMFNADNQKVGSMVFGWEFKDGKLIAKDTSKFDDGSVYETAIFTIDTTDMHLDQLLMNMETPNSKLNVSIGIQGKHVLGTFGITNGGNTNNVPIDSTFSYDIFREELYTLMHTLPFKKGDTMEIKAIPSTSFRTSEAKMYWSGEETVTTAAGTFNCDVIWLKADGLIPDNQIWLDKAEPRKIVKFYVPGPELSIELQKPKKLQGGLSPPIFFNLFLMYKQDSFV